MDEGLPRFVRYASDIRGVHPEGRTDRETTLTDMEAMCAWMEAIVLVLKTSEPGVTPENIQQAADGVVLLKGGCKALTRDDVVGIPEVSLAPSPFGDNGPRCRKAAGPVCA